MFKSLSLSGWRQFRKIDIAFHPRLTLLTGANGAGKTTLLNLVARHFGWGTQFVTTPRNRSGSGPLFYSTDHWDLSDEDLLALPNVRDMPSPPVARHNGSQTSIGTISYETGPVATLLIPSEQSGSTYDVSLANQQGVEGMHIPSHRPTFSYQAVQSIPTVPRRRNDVFNQYLSIIRQRYMGGHTQWTPQYYMKETLIALATFGFGNSAVQADPESAAIFSDFQDVLARTLPPSLGFQRLVVRVPEIILETATGEFSIDAISGGVAAVIDLAWQIFMYQPAGKRFVVTVDEPENHLHPELQRRVLADLLAAFPDVQFVVASHSPFIVGSVPESFVYVLSYDESRRVNSHLLDTANKAGSANEILRDVLGLETTMPVWATIKLQDISEKYASLDFTPENLVSLRREMNSIGLGERVTETIASLAARKDSQ